MSRNPLPSKLFRSNRRWTIAAALGGTLLLATVTTASWIASSGRHERQIEAALEPPTISSGEVTYTRDIAPIVQQHCVICHRPDDVAPFPLLTYEDVSRRARQICELTERRLMPPWKLAPEIRHFRDDLRLSDREIATIRDWTAAGRPRGDLHDLPPAPHFADSWRLGTPDLVLKVSEPFEVPADGPDIYRYFVLPTGLTEDRLIAAVEFRPDAPRVVHHAGFWFDQTGAAREFDARDPAPGYASFAGPGFPGWIGLGNWAPGTSPQRLPEGTGRLLPRGSDIVLQVHYHPTGKPERDQSSVALYFAPRSAKRRVAEIAVANMNLKIPPGANRFRLVAKYRLPVDAQLLDAYPHMHMLGREIKATAHRPDGQLITLVWIKDWSFGWQPRYVFKSPLRLPAGTEIELESIFDNSANNPANPHSPPRTVFWGEGSDDEMGMCYFQVLTDTPEDFQTLTADNLAYYQHEVEGFWRRLNGRKPKGIVR